MADTSRTSAGGAGTGNSTTGAATADAELGRADAGATIGGLRVRVTRTGHEVLRGIELTVRPGEFVGVAGETGSGKTTTGLALLGHVRAGLEVTGGEVTVGGHRMLDASPARLRALRGAVVAYVPQDPATALNPGLRLSAAVGEVLRAHDVRDPVERRRRIDATFAAVDLPHDDAFLRRYPHQLSGGQQQRVAIAAAFVLDPAVVVMDEPTTGLDATTKAAVVELVRGLSRSVGSSVVFISHDLRLLLATADRMVVMYQGEVVEDGPTAKVAADPQHSYTRALLAAVPRPVAEACTVRELGAPQEAEGAESPVDGGTATAALRRAPVLEVEALSAHHGAVTVTRGVTFQVGGGECVALVGESGSGKTTIARCVAGLHTDYDGIVGLDRRTLEVSVSGRTAAQRQALQYVFQNPFGSLNPRRTAGRSIALAAQTLRGLSRADALEAAAQTLATVGLTARHLTLLPHAMSGGERQRVALARALVARPRVLVCDEVTSSLDLSVQAGIIELLQGLQSDGLSMLFITHDLALVGAIAQQTLVLRGGAVVEAGPTTAVLTDPQHAYTRTLLALAG